MELSNYDKRIIRDFRHNFGNMTEPILLYGVGEKTEIILKHVYDINIIGIWDINHETETIYGKKVFDKNQVSETRACIVIVAALSVVPLIVGKISEVIGLTKEIYALNGRQVNKTIKTQAGEWLIKEEIEEMISQFDVISFDIFDTLIMRRCIYPEYVFHFSFSGNKELIELRKELEPYCYHNISKFFSLNDLYTEAKKRGFFTDKTVDELVETEKRWESILATPRKEICELLNLAKKLNKDVVLVSDMYLDQNTLKIILQQSGIVGYQKIYVSCEQQAQKFSGALFEKVKRDYPEKKVMHIGDNKLSDIIRATENGISAVWIPSAADIMKEQVFPIQTECLENANDMLAIGMYATYVYGDPFILQKNNGRFRLSDMEQLGFLFWGPLVYDFCIWLIQQCQKDNIEQLLFCARDGYVIKKAFEILCGGESISCETHYMLTSRRSASVASIYDQQDIIFVLRNVCKIKDMDVCQLLKQAFGVDVHDDGNCKKLYELEMSELEDYVLKYYADDIIEHAAAERKNYLKYIKKMVSREKSIALVNFVGRGITQYSIEKIINKKIQGYYFATELGIDEIVRGNSKGCFGEGETGHTSNNELFMNYLLGEVIFSAPDGQLLCFDEDGNGIFEKRNVPFDNIEKCQKGILRYMKERNGIYRGLAESSSSLSCDIIGEMTSARIEIPDDVKRCFVHTDYYSPQKEIALI